MEEGHRWMCSIDHSGYPEHGYTKIPRKFVELSTPQKGMLHAPTPSSQPTSHRILSIDMDYTHIRRFKELDAIVA